MLYTGVVENRNDPLKLGRCQVRVVGLHTEDKTILPTEDLPWATPLQPITSAAMNGLGWTPIGPVPGTWVVVMYSDDEDQQQPIIIGTLGGIYLTKNATISSDGGDIVVDEIPENAVRDSSGNVITDGFGQAVLSAIIPSKPAIIGSPAKSDVTSTNIANNNTIPTTPPPKSTSNVAKATNGIKALIAACDKVGLTTRYAKAALLGIAGGETTWIPQVEAYNYSASRMKQIYSFATDADVEKYANAEKKGMTREIFFAWAYGTTKRGPNFLGNKNDEDGGKFYGRGFIQLTGRSNYEQYAKLTGIDIVNNPDILNNDLEQSAIIAATYITKRVKNWQKLMYEEGFFSAAKTAVGVNSPDISAKKKAYYEYFLNGGVASDSTNKEATAGDTKPDATAIAAAPPEKREAYREDRSINQTKGFTDPEGKYPLRDYANEPDMNRLARGILDGTCFEFKDATRAQDIPLANGGSWSQPLSSYSATYPYNKVFETESGHVMEYDDSPLGERIHQYHRKGTFYEIDPNGSRITHIVGDDYHITDRNGNLYVAGNLNITAGTGIKILARGNADIQVEGSSNIVLQNDVTIGCAKDVSMTVANDFNLKVNGNMHFDVTGTTTHASKGIFTVQGYDNVNITSASNINNVADGTVGLKASGDVNLLASGNMNIDGSIIDLNNGAASVSKPESIKGLELVPPDVADFGMAPFNNIEPPIRSGIGVTKYETPEDWATTEGKTQSTNISENPLAANPDNTAAKNSDPDQAVKTSGNNVQGKVIDKNIYINADPKSFNRDYTISKHFTIGHFLSSSNRLIAQELPAGVGENYTGRKLFTENELVANLAELAQNIAEPMYDILGPVAGVTKVQDKNGKWVITSGLRNPGNVVQSGDGSDHNKGRAFDFQLWPGGRYQETLDLAAKLEKILPYNQLILEYRDPVASKGVWQNWIHVSYRGATNQKWAFTMYNDGCVNATGQRVSASVASNRGFYLFGPKA